MDKLNYMEVLTEDLLQEYLDSDGFYFELYGDMEILALLQEAKRFLFKTDSCMNKVQKNALFEVIVGRFVDMFFPNDSI